KPVLRLLETEIITATRGSRGRLRPSVAAAAAEVARIDAVHAASGIARNTNDEEFQRLAALVLHRVHFTELNRNGVPFLDGRGFRGSAASAARNRDHSRSLHHVVNLRHFAMQVRAGRSAGRKQQVIYVRPGPEK